MIALLAVVWPLMIGFLPARAYGRELGILVQICLGVGLGVGAISCCFFLELQTGIPSLVFEVLLTAGAGIVCWIFGWRGRGAEREEAGRAEWWLSGTLAFVVAGAAFEFFRLVSANPQGTWDAWAIWNLHARFLKTPWWRDLFSNAMEWTHPDYPLLLPGFIARVWRGLGERDLTVSALVPFLFAFATMGLLGGTVGILKGRRQGLLAALFLAATPCYIRLAASECADVPISFFILATLALVTLQDRAWRNERGLSILAGICAGMAAWTKNEGLLLVALVVPIRAVTTWRRRGGRAAREQIVWLATGLAPILALVLFFKFRFATSVSHLGGRSGNELVSLLLSAHRWRVMVTELAKDVLWFGDLPVGVPLVLMAYVGLAGIDRKTYRASQATGFVTLFMLLAGYCVVCVLSPYEIRWQTDTALERLLLQLWPATVFLAFLAANRVHVARKVVALDAMTGDDPDFEEGDEDLGMVPDAGA